MDLFPVGDVLGEDVKKGCSARSGGPEDGVDLIDDDEEGGSGDVADDYGSGDVFDEGGKAQEGGDYHEEADE